MWGNMVYQHMLIEYIACTTTLLYKTEVDSHCSLAGCKIKGCTSIFSCLLHNGRCDFLSFFVIDAALP